MGYDIVCGINNVLGEMNKSDNLNDFVNNCRFSKNEFVNTLNNTDLSDIWNSH
jgi:hypothetical protein